MSSSSEIWIRLAASMSELLGVFLLAIEAMKVENFRRLRDRVLRPFYRLINPKIEFVNDTSASEPERKRRLPGFTRDPFTWFFFGIEVLGAGGLFLISRLLLSAQGGIISVISHLVPGPLWADILVGFPIFLFASLFTGLILHTALVCISYGFIIALNMINRHTPSGTIGILGFLFYLIGFIVKIYFEFQMPR